MKPQQLWDQFTKDPNLKYSAWAFGASPDKLLKLVLDGKKRGTASSYDSYAYYKEEFPQVEEYSVLLDSKGDAHCIIQTINITICEFREVTDGMAAIEGEGDGSLRYWKRVHQEFFEMSLKK